ncbi:MAG: hypothetical protein WD079_05765, partial [Phycisphaeraceae bacterium]
SDELLIAARRSWDAALTIGERHGFRNAQTTVIAPTGTIGLLMDCDTTGVEPDFSLVKFKKLAGGGYFKIANQSLRPALVALGYDQDQVRDIMDYVMGRQDLNVPLPDVDGHASEGGETFAEFLIEKGFDLETLDRVRETLAGAMELGFIFNAWTLGAEKLQELGFADEPDLLAALGLTRKQVESLNELICGTGTVEGAPHLEEAHLPVFDCANKCGRKGERFIAPEGHIRAMAAVQPFISGAISKTINMPNAADVDQIKQAYRLSWELGIKANALYRDGCKLSQPLNATTGDDEAEDEEGIEAGKEEVSAEVATAAGRVATAADGGVVEKIVERIVERPMRKRLPNTRRSLTHKFSVAGHEGYLTVGLYDDGSPGELFITMAKEGSTIGGLMDSLGTAISVALQYGVPIESLVTKFSHQRFEPAGMTGNREIPFAKSLVDYIFRWMGMEFIPGYRAANAPKRPSSEAKEQASAKSSAPARPAAKSEAKASNGGAAEGKTDAKSDSVGGRLGDDDAGGSEKAERQSRIALDDPDLAEKHQLKNGPLNKMSSKTSAAMAVADRQNATGAALVSTLNEANSQLMGDAPACDVCGSITIRNGTCYKCLNCGNSMGCS